MSQNLAVLAGSATLQNTPVNRVVVVVGIDYVWEAYSDKRQENHGSLDVHGVKASTADQA